MTEPEAIAMVLDIAFKFDIGLRGVKYMDYYDEESGETDRLLEVRMDEPFFVVQFDPDAFAGERSFALEKFIAHELEASPRR